MGGLKIRFDDGGSTAAIRKLISGMADARPALKILGAVMIDSIEENFKEGGRPPWKQSKRALRDGGKTLVDTRNLENSLTDSSKSMKITGNTLYVGTNVEYAAIHQFGGKIKPKNKPLLVFLTSGERPTDAAGWKQAREDGRAVFAKEITMPARPFLVVRDEDLDEAAAQIIDYLKGEIGK
jgi:phage gpG-like protein